MTSRRWPPGEGSISEYKIRERSPASILGIRRRVRRDRRGGLMSPDAPRAGPVGPARHVQQAAKLTESRSALTVTRAGDELAVRRELRAWAATAAWLNRRGYAAAVPPRLVGPLSRRGLVVWAADERRPA